jgi:hypothetical protein
VRLEGLEQLKKTNDLIGNRTHDLPACSIVPQPTTVPRAPPSNFIIKLKLMLVENTWLQLNKGHNLKIKLHLIKPTIRDFRLIGNNIRISQTHSSAFNPSAAALRP